MEVPGAVRRLVATLDSGRGTHSYRTGAVLSRRAKRWGNAVHGMGIIKYYYTTLAPIMFLGVRRSPDAGAGIEIDFDVSTAFLNKSLYTKFSLVARLCEGDDGDG